MYVSSAELVWINLWLYQFLLWSAEQEGKRLFSPCPRSCMRIGLTTGSDVPTCVSPLILLKEYNIQLTAIGSVLSLSGHAVACRWRSLPRVRRHRAKSSPQGSSSNGPCIFKFQSIMLEVLRIQYVIRTDYRVVFVN